MKIYGLQLLELLSISSTFFYLISFCFRKSTHFSFTLIILLILILYFILETSRWQIIPTLIVFVIVSLFLFFNISSGLPWRITGAILGSVLLGLSFILVIGFPLKSLPSPSGKYLVGTTFFNNLETKDPNRNQYVQIWYPVNKGANTSQFTVRTLWQQIYEPGSEHDNKLQFFTKFLAGIETHSYEDAPLAISHEKFPILSYQHSLVSFTSENTLLMETLASNGYIVIANSYKNHFEESKDNTIDFKKPMDEKELLGLLKKAKNRKEVSDLMCNYALSSERINFLVKNRVQDASYILDNVVALLNKKISLKSIEDQIDVEKIGVIGYSLGGATAIEMSKGYENCSVGINLDGINYGQSQNENLNIPFLSFSKEITAGANDALMENSTDHFLDITIGKTEHTNFHEMSFFFPIVKWFGVSGKTNAEKTITYRNNTILHFLDMHLKGIPYEFEKKVKDIEIEVVENI